MISLHVLPATAQDPPDAVATAPIRVGPLGFGPRLAFTNIGIDTNVFNEAENPKQDFTLTASPGVELWLRTGKGMLSAQGRMDLAYFAKYSDQTSVSSSVSGEYEYRFNRVRPLVSFTSLNSRGRPGYEIDARVRSHQDNILAGVDLRLAGKSYLQFDYRLESTLYTEDAVFDGQKLDRSLNRTVRAVEAVFRHKLTAMTTWVVQASSEQERFEFATDRNSNSARVSTGFELGRFALIRGRAHVGFRSLAAAEGGTLPAFRGVTADVDVSYTAPSQTRLTLQSARDIEYSYNPRNPYYVQTGVSLTLTQRVVGRWDVQAVGGRDRLSYRAALPEGFNHSDEVDRVGGGIGYQIAERVRVSVDAQSQHRTSGLHERGYRTLRVGGSVTYGY